MRITYILRRTGAALITAALLLAGCAPAARQTPTFAPTETAVPSATSAPALAPTLALTPTTAFTPTKAFTPTAAPTLTRTPWPAGLPSLRQLAEKRSLLIGAAVQSGLIANEQPYRETLIREFNEITAENEMKMCAIWPERDRWDFSGADALVKFAAENGMKIRGHTLVWVGCEPSWLTPGAFSKDEAKAILKEYITTVVSRYKGKVFAWDVLNETVQRPSVWDSLIGAEYRALAFQWAHEADPGALLFYNDFNFEKPGDKFNAVYAFVKELKDQRVPIHGVGMQMHFGVVPYMKDVAKTMKMFNDLGLEVQVTEFDLPIDHYSKDPYAYQAQGYREMLQVCLQAQKCTAFIMWGFTDAHTWLNKQLNDPEANPLIFDRNYQPKPAYEALWEELNK